jgi:hypothetical protein
MIYKTNNCNFAIIESDNFLQNNTQDNTRPVGAVEPIVILVRTDYSLEEINRIDQDDELPQNSPILIRQNAKYPDRV